MSADRVEHAPVAQTQIRKLDPVAQDRVIRTIALLGSNPRPPKATQLVGGGGEWRVRTGDYRIVYEVHDDVLVVLVVRVGHRREVYRNL